MDTKKRLLTLAVMCTTLGLSGCSGVGWSVKGTCTGSNCSVSGEIHGGPQQKLMADGRQDTYLTAATASNLLEVDASAVVIDTSNSSIAIPASGNLTLKLVNSTSGYTLAARTFSWVKHGSEITLADPNSANVWIQENGVNADDLQYELAPFAIAEESGSNTFVTAVSYAGETQASSTFTWTGSGGGTCRLCQVE
ncbi:MAG: hypothetical protein NW204_09125 [Xanthomonadaceae bacterium]|nr:hypothetical protein [Xanthomonadaceae bacterium]